MTTTTTTTTTTTPTTIISTNTLLHLIHKALYNAHNTIITLDEQTTYKSTEHVKRFIIKLYRTQCLTLTDGKSFAQMKTEATLTHFTMLRYTCKYERLKWTLSLHLNGGLLVIFTGMY
uniref:Uncharacterized protein n=1 Tax=Glossina austeni TaxID=7395 RepID=A0A1A9VFX3_GLOAU